MRSAIQLLRSIGTSNATSRNASVGYQPLARHRPAVHDYFDGDLARVGDARVFRSSMPI